MIVFKGSMEKPEFEHGETVVVNGLKSTIQHRRHTGFQWEYGLLMDGIPGIMWYVLKK